MVKTTPLSYKNKSPFLYTAYAHLYTTVPHNSPAHKRKASPSHESHTSHENGSSSTATTTTTTTLTKAYDGATAISTNSVDEKASTITTTTTLDKGAHDNTTTSQKKTKPAEWPHIWLFGSLAVNEGNAFSVTDGNCFRFNWGLGDWEKQQVNFEARYQFASCQFGNKILLHGGFRNYTKNHLLSSIQIFDMETRELQNIDTDLALACHSGTYHKLSHSFIVFGGRSKQCGKCTRKTLYKFSLDTHQWEKIPVESNVEPGERYGHSLVLYGNNTLVLFGGKNQKDELLNDLWFFDLTTNQWEQIQDTVGDVPPGRHFHYALRHHHTMYILGGEEPEDADDNNHPLYALDLKTRHWDALRVTGRLNTRRIGVSMALFSNDLIGESIVAFGGMVKTKRQVRTTDNKKVEVTVPLSNEMFHITSIPQYKLKRKLEALGDVTSNRPKKRQKITPRKLVAAHVDEEWILARIVKSLDNGTYELEDAQAMTEDNEEDSKVVEETPKTYIVHGDNIARLSATLKDHIPLPRGTKVLALYPGTSCLYPGVIEDHGDESYYVLFEDDEEDGETPLREIGFKLLCRFQEGIERD
mmetsp:Transcript_2370/g.8893  ORF Transcript_2370/g.8893 Transcript_2370/m.8893 type:complete len:584 (-) Transcript_2370:2347-4098(-)|eukprot:CAMPEP_0117444096 /NCGR_PEP_ID=MMETSP0759-20121206/5052_1 /TAXON_ID=63605 /ORGANISM="Percolomonas cosmopolitus, Strain WS" /LENGTH=583 /DNA_ID=CAMNT_0005236127 /DNA_START=342 /DNA_END=2093 /DNA_ORIENTATION=-